MLILLLSLASLSSPGFQEPIAPTVERVFPAAIQRHYLPDFVFKSNRGQDVIRDVVVPLAVDTTGTARAWLPTLVIERLDGLTVDESAKLTHQPAGRLRFHVRDLQPSVPNSVRDYLEDTGKLTRGDPTPAPHMLRTHWGAALYVDGEELHRTTYVPAGPIGVVRFTLSPDSKRRLAERDGWDVQLVLSNEYKARFKQDNLEIQVNLISQGLASVLDDIQQLAPRPEANPNILLFISAGGKVNSARKVAERLRQRLDMRLLTRQGFNGGEDLVERFLSQLFNIYDVMAAPRETDNVLCLLDRDLAITGPISSITSLTESNIDDLLDQYEKDLQKQVDQAGSQNKELEAEGSYGPAKLSGKYKNSSTFKTSDSVREHIKTLKKRLTDAKTEIAGGIAKLSGISIGATQEALRDADLYSSLGFGVFWDGSRAFETRIHLADLRPRPPIQDQVKPVDPPKTPVPALVLENSKVIVKLSSAHWVKEYLRSYEQEIRFEIHMTPPGAQKHKNIKSTGYFTFEGDRSLELIPVFDTSEKVFSRTVSLRGLEDSESFKIDLFAEHRREGTQTCGSYASGSPLCEFDAFDCRNAWKNRGGKPEDLVLVKRVPTGEEHLVDGPIQTAYRAQIEIWLRPTVVYK